MTELFHYFIANWPKILWLTWQHIDDRRRRGRPGDHHRAFLSASPPHRTAASPASVLYTASIIMTIPSMALFGVLIPILALINRGIGYVPAVIAIFLYSQLPIISNTYAAFRSIDPALREAAQGMGMTRLQRLRLVEAPLVVPVIIAGVRTAIVLNIGIAAIAAYIGAGGLGLLIRSGITQTDTRQILAGAIAVSVLALVIGSAVRAAAAAAHVARPRPRMIQIEKLSKEYVQDGRRVVAARRHRSRSSARRDLRASRAVGLRQDDDAQDHQSPGRLPPAGGCSSTARTRASSTRSRCAGRSAT